MPRRRKSNHILQISNKTRRCSCVHDRNSTSTVTNARLLFSLPRLLCELVQADPRLPDTRRVSAPVAALHICVRAVFRGRVVFSLWFVPGFSGYGMGRCWWRRRRRKGRRRRKMWWCSGLAVAGEERVADGEDDVWECEQPVEECRRQF